MNIVHFDCFLSINIDFLVKIYYNIYYTILNGKRKRKEKRKRKYEHNSSG